MRDFSKAFQSIEGGFLGNLTLSKTQSQFILSAKTKIQNCLRQGILEKIEEREHITVEPRFMSQGSGVYRTRNKPCYVPPQQIDHDLGCYLPLSIAKEFSELPKIATKVFFSVVDDLLKELVIKERWIDVDISKNTCSRVIVNDEVHIDVPLYAIPDTEFITIREKIDKSLAYENFASIESRRIASWRDIDIKKVLLAHREQNWIESDPRKLNVYFKKAFEHKGEQLRRICRYLKAWRDYQWKKNGPTSIYLMLFADSLFDTEIDRDDIALLNILQGISRRLSDKNFNIINPTDPKEEIKISDIDRQQLFDLSNTFANDLRTAIHENTIPDEKATELIRKNLGNRFPTIVIPSTDASIRDKVFSTPISHDEERRPSTRTRAG
jgi:hypothetical protein